MLGLPGRAQEDLTNKAYLDNFFPNRYFNRCMFPQTFPKYNESNKGMKAEEHFYNIVKEIEEAMVVFYSFKTCVDKMIEADFVIFHKTRGIMVFEVKCPTRGRGMGNYLQQATKNAEAIKRIVDKHLKIKKKDVRYSVAMPNCNGHPVYYPGGENLFKGNLKSKESFQDWLDEFRPTNGREFTDKEYDKCLEYFLNRLPIEMNRIYDQLVKLTPAQADIVNGLQGDECYITGPAGSGKTEVMILKAKEENRHKQKKLIVVYHRPLSKYLKLRLEGVHNLEILMFRELLERLACMGLRQTSIAQHSNTHLINLVIRCLTTNPNDPRHTMKWDSIFVDEAQDMEGENWEILIDMIHNKKTNHLKFIFFDSNQRLTSCTNPPNPNRKDLYHLKNVIRNTKNIFESSQPFYNYDCESNVYHNCNGPPVVWYSEFTENEVKNVSDGVVLYISKCVEEMWRELQEVKPMDICVLVEDELKAENLRNKISAYTDSTLHPFDVDEMIERMRMGSWPENGIPESKCGVVVDSISNYKGLGSKAVILLVNHRNESTSLIESMYSGITRSMCKLIIITSRSARQQLDQIAAIVDTTHVDVTMNTPTRDDHDIEEINYAMEETTIEGDEDDMDWERS